MSTSRKAATTALTLLAVLLAVAWFAASTTPVGTAALYLALATWNLAAIAWFGPRKVRSASTAK